MRKETMTPRERWLAVLKREKPDRVPMDYWGTREATEKVMKHLGVSSVDEMLERLHVDKVVGIGPKYVGPKLAENANEYGILHRSIDYGTGVYEEVTFRPLAAFNSVAEIETHYRWPSPDWYDFSAIPSRVKAAGERPIQGGGSEPFLTYCALRGQEQAFMDLVINKDIARYCLDKLFDLCYENSRRVYEAAGGRVMISYVAEDMGSQEDLMFSPAQIHEFLLPRMKRMIDLAHQAGAYVFHHSDGAIRKIIPDMIAIGIDVLNPIQWRCKGMEREGLKRDFGDKLIFHGGVDNQQTLPFGTVADVRQEVIDNLRILGAGGGYILAPCHNIQAVSPPENVVAMYETGYENGWQ
jgi:uroporphyrinogen decarboxylase